MVAGDSPDPGTPAAIPPDHGTGSDDPASRLRQLGEELVAARRDLGLSRRELADRLHLGESQLAALEQGNSDLLPEPVYIRAWLRTLAHALGLDPDRLLARLPADLQRNGRVQATQAPPKPDPVPVARARPPRRPPVRRGAALAAVALLAIAIGGTLTLHSGRKPDNGPAEAGREPVSAAEETPPMASAGGGAEGQAGAGAAEILIRAKPGAPSWISLRDGRGTLVFEGLLEGSRTIAAGDGIELLAGRPDLVSVGRSDADLQPLGSISEVRWVALDPLVAGPPVAGAGP